MKRTTLFSVALLLSAGPRSIPAGTACCVLAALVLAPLAGCGSSSAGCASDTAARDASSPQDAVGTGIDDVAAGTAVADLGSAQDGGANATTYSGVVVARIAQVGETNHYSAFADFTTGPPFGIVPYSTNGLGTESCGCQEGLSALPLQPTDAAAVTLTSAEGTRTLAMLAPVGLGGNWIPDLGPGWRWINSAYTLVASQPWKPGDALAVSATGNQVHAFSGTLHTGAPLSGVTPVIGPAPVIIDLTQNFEVSWSPEGISGEIVLLMLRRGGLTCYCIVPDAAAKVTVDSSVVGGFGNAYYVGTGEPPSGTILLDRLVTSTASGDNATIALIGEVMQTGTVTFQ